MLKKPFVLGAPEESPTALSAVMSLKRELEVAGKKIFDMALGNPTHAIPPWVQRALELAAREARMPYTFFGGIPEVRRAVAGHVSRMYGYNWREEHILITDGIIGGVFAMNALTMGTGCFSLICAPTYPSYISRARLCGGEVAIAHTRPEDGWIPSVEELERCFSKYGDAIRLVTLNYPNNPTGAILSEDKAVELATYLSSVHERYNRSFLLILDHAYIDFSYETHTHLFSNAMSPSLRDHTVILGTASKLEAVPSARAGYTVGHKDVIHALKKIQASVYFGPNHLGQRVLKESLSKEFLKRRIQLQECISPVYERKQRFIVERLNSIAKRGGWESLPVPEDCFPKSGMFVLADFSSVMGKVLPKHLQERLGKTSIEIDSDLARLILLSGSKNGLLDGVATISGEVFGLRPEQGYLRLYVGGSYDTEAAWDEGLHNAMNCFEETLLVL